MCKRLALALMLVLIFSFSASAEVTGVYVAPKFLMSIQDTGNITTSFDGIDALEGRNSQFTAGGGLAAGYDFYPKYQIPLRAEIEFALRGDSEKSWNVSDLGLNLETKGKWNASTLFANFYFDLHNSTDFTPYIGAGLGMAFLHSSYSGVLSAGGASIGTSYNKQTTNFAWNAGAGCSYAFNDNFSADVAYRFVGMGASEASTTYAGVKIKTENAPYANEFMLGLRMTF